MNNIVKHMNGFFRHFIKKQLILCCILFTLTFIIMLFSPQQDKSVLAYEDLIELADIQVLFAIALFCWVLMIAFDVLSNIDRGNGLRVFMMLPGRRRHVFIAFALVGLTTILMVFATQLLALIAAYAPTMGLAQSNADNYVKALVNQGHAPFVAEAGRTNGLYLAMITSDLFRFLLPQSPIEFAGWATLLLMLGTFPSFIVFCATRIEIGFLTGLFLATYSWLDMRMFDPYAAGNLEYSQIYVLPPLIASAAIVYMIVTGVLRLNSRAKLR